MFKKAFSALLAGVIAASAAVTSAGCLTVGAGAVTEKKEYSGSWYAGSLPAIQFKSSDDIRESGIYYEDSVNEKGTDVYVLEDIKPTDVITYYATTLDGVEYVLNIGIRTKTVYWLTSISDTNFYEKSGISVQNLINEYNNDIHSWDYEHKYDGQNETFDSVYGIRPYACWTYEFIGNEYVNTSPFADLQGEKVNWRITIEPGSNSNNAKQSDISSLTFGKITNKAYTGKAITPAVTVKDGSKKLTEGTDYTVSYKNNTKIGTATATITGKGDYSGTKTVKFKIVPKKAKLSGSVSDTKAALSWNKSKGATGYEVYCSVDGGKFTKLKTTKALKYTAKLAKGNSYQFKVRPYTLVNGKKVYGSWSNVIKAN